MRIFPYDDPIGRSLRTYGEWARHELRVLCTYLGLGSSVVDIGANVGTHALSFARRVGPTGSVLAIEPQRAVFDLLEHNATASGLGQLRTLRAAVGAAEGELAVPTVNYHAHVNLGAVELRPVSSEEGEERVPLIPLDQLALSACHLVKVDAEGFGPQVLAGMRQTVSRSRPVVAAECNSVQEAAELLQAAHWPDYDVVLLRASAFNANNFAGYRENFFGVATETTLLFVPRELRHMTPASQAGAELIAVNGLDDLAAAILASPRYGDATAHDRDAAWLGTALRAAETRLEEVRAEAEERLRKSAADAAEVETRLEFRNAALTARLRAVQEQLSDAQEQFRVAQEQLRATLVRVAHAEARIDALYASASWRLTSPVRRAARLLRVRP
jgi:FkbM family methyltransferase